MQGNMFHSYDNLYNGEYISRYYVRPFDGGVLSVYIHCLADDILPSEAQSQMVLMEYYSVHRHYHLQSAYFETDDLAVDRQEAEHLLQTMLNYDDDLVRAMILEHRL